MKGPVLPLKSMLSSGLKSMFLRASTLRMKYFSAPIPTMRATFCFSSSVISLNFPSSSLVLRASSIIAAISSSASTTVPSRLFILPFGSSTIP